MIWSMEQFYDSPPPGPSMCPIYSTRQVSLASAQLPEKNGNMPLLELEPKIDSWLEISRGD